MSDTETLEPVNKFPKITEQGLADLRTRIGVKIENTIEPWNYEAAATRSATTRTASATTIRCGVTPHTPRRRSTVT